MVIRQNGHNLAIYLYRHTAIWRKTKIVVGHNEMNNVKRENTITIWTHILSGWVENGQLLFRSLSNSDNIVFLQLPNYSLSEYTIIHINPAFTCVWVGLGNMFFFCYCTISCWSLWSHPFSSFYSHKHGMHIFYFLLICVHPPTQPMTPLICIIINYSLILLILNLSSNNWLLCFINDLA